MTDEKKKEDAEKPKHEKAAPKKKKEYDSMAAAFAHVLTKEVKQTV